MSYEDFLRARFPDKSLATATDDNANRSVDGSPASEEKSNNFLSEVFGNRKERTLAGNVIGSVRDVFSGNLTEEEKTKRAESNEFMATIAADTAAMMSKRVAIGGLIRAGMMADTKGNGTDFALGFVKDGLEGAGLNYLGKMAAPGSSAYKFAESRLGTGLKQEIGLHAGAGAMFGVLKAGSDPNAWRDQAGHFSFESGFNNLTDWKKLTTAGLTGAVINVPAGMVGFRIAKSSTVALANRTGSEAFGTVAGGVLSGSGSGALFGGLDAAMHGKSLKEIGASTLDGMYIGAATGGAMTAWHTFRPGAKPVFDNTSEQNKGRQQDKVQIEEKMALATKDERKLPSDRREIETQGELFWTIKAEKWYQKVTFEPPPKPALVDLHKMLKRTEIVDYDVRRVNADSNVPEKFENWAEFVKHTHVAKERSVVFKVEGVDTKIIVPETSEKVHNEIRRLRHLAEIDAPSFDNLSGTVRTELQQHAMAGNIAPLLARFGIKAEPIAQIIRARVELNTNPLYRRALPEDFIPALKELPDPNLVKELVLLEEPSFSDRYRRKTDDTKATAAAATATDDGKITFFEMNNSLPKGSTSKGAIREFLSHEWAHLLKHKYKLHSALFNEAAEFETGFYAREYAKRQYPDHPGLKHHENFAVHLGENLMMPDADAFFTTANHAPIRTVVMAKALIESMVPGKAKGLEEVVHPANFKARIEKIPEMIPNHDQVVARLNYIADEIVPIARQKLLQQAASGSPDDRLRASMLLGRIGHPADVPEAHRIATQAFDPKLRKSLFDSMANIASTNMDARVQFMIEQAKPGMPLREEALAAMQHFQHPEAKSFYEVYSLVGNDANLPKLIEALKTVSSPAAKKVAFNEIVSLAAKNAYGDQFINSYLVNVLRTEPTIRMDVLNYAARRLNSSLEPELMRLQRAADRDVAERAKDLLAQVRTNKILEQSQRWLHGDDAERKYEAIQELAWLGDNRAVPILLQTVVSAPPKWSNEALAALRHYSPNIIQAHAHDLQRNGYPALRWGDIQHQLRMAREPVNQPFLQQAATRTE